MRITAGLHCFECLYMADLHINYGINSTLESPAFSVFVLFVVLLPIYLGGVDLCPHGLVRVALRVVRFNPLFLLVV